MGENGRHHSYVFFDVFWGESIKITAWSILGESWDLMWHRSLEDHPTLLLAGCCWLMTTQEKNRDNPKELGEQVC